MPCCSPTVANASTKFSAAGPPICEKIVRVLHRGDWQLGKAFGRVKPDVGAAFTKTRFDEIDAIGQVARP
jgi:hypothetical protein